MGLLLRLMKPRGITSRFEGDVRDIVDNLNNILNTRRDYGAPLGNLGMSDLSAYTSKDDIVGRIIEDIRKNVDELEPRLEVLNVEHTANDSSFYLSFILHCRLRDGQEAVEVVFDNRNKSFNLNWMYKD